jgi:hypothetical protein
MAELLNIEDAPYGQTALLQAAAQAAQQEPIPAAELDAAQAVEQSVGAAQGQAPAAPSVAPAPKPQPRQPFTGITGALQAPAVMQQPMRVPFEREQEVAMLWQTVAGNRGTPLTSMIAGRLSGVD